ncbi:SDR family NAD(P)-dependent oxidoreductase [Alteribacillus bidgolensis]|uniref:3-oxoacyl-[acyl-carrier protein] reductase n=1 Tax=Alteribacillus bidgolensis TaxID=930129 RepID=A0A1G8NIE9_9BACI|nr:SDR family NAD(P)-dependent oxidoreductase [Alteribacillus bidgolensis]SDI79867.1 3-oxoacyl-[acyl-carrier protein] reductase [Alteribacillus bidgolensis]
MSLDNKVAIVTGASRGVGRATALALAENGSAVVINGTNIQILEELAEEIETMGSESMIQAGDVTVPQTAKEVVESTINRFNKIDILVNNAGINRRSSTLDMTLEEWDEVLNVNLNANLYFSKAVLPHMINQNAGKIINVSSTAGKAVHRNAAPSYGTAKAGVNYLTMHLAMEGAPHNILVNGVCPGPIETDMSKQWSEEYHEQILQKIPLKRLGKPEDVANTILFLASEKSDFITGETININGGSFMN